MKIIGGKDYYDSGMRFGRDELVMYVRHKNKTLRYDSKTEPQRSRWDFTWKVKNITSRQIRSDLLTVEGKDYHVDYPCVWFCGVEYLGIKITHNLSSEYFWSAESLRKWTEPRRVSATLRRGTWETIYTQNRWETFTVEDYFASRNTSNWFAENHIAIAVWLDDGPDWLLDPPILNRLRFQQAKDAFTAFQELYAFISNWATDKVIAPPRVEIVDDKVKLAKHGMDKWSFRKQKQAPT